MTIFKDFSQNGQLLSVRDESLNTQNFSRYVTEYGVERAEGYQQATIDLVKQIDLILYHPREDGSQAPNTPAVIRRNLLDFLKERQAFVTAIQLIETENPLSVPNYTI